MVTVTFKFTGYLDIHVPSQWSEEARILVMLDYVWEMTGSPTGAFAKVRTVLTGAYRFVDLGKSEIRPYRSLDLGNRSLQIEVKSL